MANTNKPFGLRPYGTLNAASYGGNVRKYFVPATDGNAIYVGDTVKLAGSSGSLYNTDPSYPTAAIAASGNNVLGVCVGVEPLYSDLNINYRKASTAMYIFVDVDPKTIYEMQSDATGVVAANVGLNAEISVVAGSTTTGRSNSVLTTPGADATHDLQILGLHPAVDNEAGAYARVLVKLNLHQFRDAVIGA